MFDFTKFNAHTKGADGKEDPLIDHLIDVATMARFFAEKFNSGALAFWLGLLHDLGKINPLFQSYLKAMEENRSHSKQPHAIWGAAFIYDLLWFKNKKDAWKEFTLPVYGHHTGLEDHSLASQKLSRFLKEKSETLQSMSTAWTELYQRFTPESPSFNIVNNTSREMRIRMVFSALVDADYISTENHFDPQKTHNRGNWPTLRELWDLFWKDQQELFKKAEAKPSEVNRVRREVYDASLKTSKKKTGIFRLTVPTGGGKTRSGLAFALQHAIQNDLHRIIVVLPYTSIIDQTASEYRKILEKGGECVLEHHSQIDVPDEKEEQDPKHLRYRLATENWNVPVIVTTTVQLLESLFTNKPSRARKLHNISKSVLIFDEVQTMPPQLLKPTLDVLRDLVDHYSVSLVFSTATQPAFYNTPFLKPFQDLEVKEIVPDFPRHFASLQRVNYEFYPNPLEWSELAKEIKHLSQVMVVLNTRKDALNLIDAMGETPHIYHLSTLLCGRHRRDKLMEIRDRLKAKQTVRLISTQVVEAGVDLDFPVVYRALGPLDRIVQAAGRCNREGKSDKGQVVIFEPSDGRMPRGPYFAGFQKAKLILDENHVSKLSEPQIFTEYFERLYGNLDLDESKIQIHREAFDYPKVASLYRLISDNTLPVAVRYDDYEKHLDDWKNYTSRSAWRQLQPFIINVFEYEARQYIQDGIMEGLGNNLYLWNGKYDEKIGAGAEYDPTDLIV